ncbi:hypothetical protein UA08_04578 [Talaromyces atroroseus]|uniref:Major facilitator superfamily (MFS) profile domain-containing protein n=1 Tax=Talaromyces atroroseus TaxID=1441469 RepID=A0A225B318_TALAT|nr:hypothetical protein UA08_04578 [Talaromyces atroroseus]OKL60247.1 hypothetical protein UA08_04578 [Talaromyces atroroseus]
MGYRSPRVDADKAALGDAEKGNNSTVQPVGPDGPVAAAWDGPDDPRDPYNWTKTRKISIALVISLSQLVCLMTTSIVAPALPQIATDLHLGESKAQIAFSIFVLGQAFGPFVIAPLSEVFGRKPVWITFNLFYIFWNSLCPVGKSQAVLIIGRLLSGAGGSCGVILSGPIMADMFHQKDRGKSLAIASMFPYLGPALGPIVGGIVSQYVSWPWLFWVMSIFDAVVVAFGVVIVKETCKPVLLRRKTGHDKGGNAIDLSPSEDGLLSRMRARLQRPLLLLGTRPIIQITALVIGLGFGIYILVLSFFATLFVDQYHQSTTDSSLQYIAIALGSTLATQAGGQLMDAIFARLRDRLPEGSALRETPPPEFRVPIMVIGALLSPIGLFWLGWSVQARAPWIMVDIGATIFVAGTFLASQAASAYLLDEFTVEAASATAAARMLSNLMGFTFPLFAPNLYDRLGYGWGNSLLAFVWIALVVPIPAILWYRGDRIRAIGRK